MRLGSSSSRPRARPVAAMGGVPDHLASLTRRDMQCRPETSANETREGQRADLATAEPRPTSVVIPGSW